MRGLLDAAAQRALDNPGLDELGKPVVTFLALVAFYPHANLRHYRSFNFEPRSSS